MNHLLNNLNAEQLKGVTLPDLNALINAGAGSGKTKVLTTRIAWLCQQKNIKPWQILAVTFTNKAAKEMKERLLQYGVNVEGLWVGTFHALCNKILRLHYQEAGLNKNFIILDESEQLSFLKKTLKNNNFDPKIVGAEKIQQFINKQKEKGLRAINSSQNNENKFYFLYQEALKKEGVCDFAELLLGCYELLNNYPDLAQRYQEKFKYILVDEFQDTNSLQYSWIKLIAKKNAIIFAVGDLDQSIYRFRGAEPKNLQLFLQDFHPVTVINLEQNYRSTGHILNAANVLIDHNPNRLEKKLWTNYGNGEKIVVSLQENDLNEAEWIADHIIERNSKNYPLKEMAILYRTNAQSRSLEKILTAKNIPFVIYGGFRFFDRTEIKHAMAYLRLLHNQHDNLAFRRVVNFPHRKIGETTLLKLEAASQANHCSLWDGVKFLTGNKTNLINFQELIIKMQNDYLNLSLPSQVKNIIIDSGLEDLYKQDKETGEDKLQNLYELISAATVFVQENIEPDFEDFFANSILDSEVINEKNNNNLDSVKLMTVHSAKGLEFDHVFISGLEEGLFPHLNSLDNKEALEEERRLMYVAITRAKKRLYFSHAQERLLHGNFVNNFPSRFIDEIPFEHKSFTD